MVEPRNACRGEMLTPHKPEHERVKTRAVWCDAPILDGTAASSRERDDAMHPSETGTAVVPRATVVGDEAVAHRACLRTHASQATARGCAASCGREGSQRALFFAATTDGSGMPSVDDVDLSRSR